MMRYFPRQFSWIIFALAVIALILIAFGADATMTRYAVSEEWVSHTHEVRTALAKLGSDLFAARSGTLGYILTGDDRLLAEFEQAKRAIPADLSTLDQLTVDNSSEQERLARLKPLIGQRMGTLEEAIAIHKGGQADTQAQQQLAASRESLEPEVQEILIGLETEEESLLREREANSDQKYRRVRAVLLVGFIAALLLLFANFQRLLIELRDRERAEEAVRRLSARILHIQDEERRRIARELHDSIGQLFVALKLNLGRLDRHEAELDTEKAKILSESLQILDQGIVEARTLSHLLHPPLLDEMGFVSAAEWFVDGFSKRSNLQVNLVLPPQPPRMPRTMELALFRVLQESLTNVHRHAKSPSVDIQLECLEELVKLSVKDHGKGIPAALLAGFNKTGTGVGVGLAGMRERMIDLGGKLEIESDDYGTLLVAIVPLPGKQETDRGASGSSLSEKGTELKVEQEVGVNDR